MIVRLVILLASFHATTGLTIAQPMAPIREVVAQSNSPAGTFSARLAAGITFRLLAANDELFSGDLIVSLPGGALTSKNGAVRLKSLTDYDVHSPLPILETAFTLLKAADGDADLDLILDRGRIDLTNAKASGSAAVRVRFRDQKWKLVLETPESRASIELVSRWPSGERFRVAKGNSETPATVAPVAYVVLRDLRGEVSLNVDGTTVSMRAPPGPAEFRWNSLAGMLPQAQRLDKLPDWVNPPNKDSDAAKVIAVCEKLRVARIKDETNALDQFLESDDLIERRVALVALGGQDNLDRLITIISQTKHADVRDFGIVVLRHWLGLSSSNSQRLYNSLASQMDYTASQSQIVLQLLLGFTAEDLVQPETSQVLSEYLLNAKPIVRSLAAWHLVRLYPEGKTIPFKPNGTGEDISAFHAAWKKLLLAARVPPKPVKP